MARNLTMDEVDRVATLAHLALADEEKTRLSAELGRILDFASQISALDTRDVPPTALFLEVEPVEREDEARPCLPREEALANAPEVASHLITVPRVPGQD